MCRFFAVRVRSTTGRYCFHRCVSVHICRGGGGLPPHLADRGGGTPSFLRGEPPSFLMGYLILPDGGGGVPPSQVWMVGYPLPRSGQGVPPVSRMGYPPPIQTWEGVPPCLDLGRGTPPVQTWEGGTPIQIRSQDMGVHPQPEQHSVYLLRGRRYASCVHGGLSYCCKFTRWRFTLTVVAKNKTLFRFDDFSVVSINKCLHVAF